MEDTKLALADHNEATDAVITAQSLPGLTGNGPSDLICGQCGEVVGKGLDTGAIARTFETKRRLLLKCTCGAHNLIAEATDERAGGSDEVH